jgi:hypothetical protein
LGALWRMGALMGARRFGGTSSLPYTRVARGQGRRLVERRCTGSGATGGAAGQQAPGARCAAGAAADPSAGSDVGPSRSCCSRSFAGPQLNTGRRAGYVKTNLPKPSSCGGRCIDEFVFRPAIRCHRPSWAEGEQARSGALRRDVTPPPRIFLSEVSRCARLAPTAGPASSPQPLMEE